VTTPRPPTPGPSASKNAHGVPYYDFWLARMSARAVPARAAALMPRLQAAFVAEGVPPELAWLAEAESSLNPAARSPVGAKGLFQFMPDTAHAMGLGTFMPDERSDPEKSAHAAARYLRELHAKFGEWPLVFAAYNAGEGRVSRLLAARNAKSFSAIAGALPAETRMYVPKVCATVAVRAGIAPENIGPPRRE
jgi:membrane-bound lytic murein transglycosylase D